MPVIPATLRGLGRKEDDGLKEKGRARDPYLTINK
jgi:hypothetical protein